MTLSTIINGCIISEAITPQDIANAEIVVFFGNRIDHYSLPLRDFCIFFVISETIHQSKGVTYNTSFKKEVEFTSLLGKTSITTLADLVDVSTYISTMVGDILTRLDKSVYIKDIWYSDTVKSKLKLH